MKAFEDAKGRRWELSLTIGSAKRVLEKLGVNLLEPEGGEPPLLTRLGADAMLLCDVLYVLCEPQAEKNAVSDIDFGESLGGDAIREAMQAFYEELIYFFQQSGRPDRAKMVQKQREMIRLAVQNAEGLVDRIDTQEEVLKAFGLASGSSQG
ncbi:MAG TPA: hypothetical protein PLX18_12705 [Anaerohalosphaeraceae bacterium]|nr:hypothetical protein [Anaerohalosphaeraceae bacterium]HQG07018.1 hypothetical protein [Anaerohalosphaeraceae bacterium]HQI08705.1 hypothetical protein [Anaerohalosphaeraceae bacterium]HQJ68972.1 hypothetical protein [Anaerohalosphaeraceae bacterium]